MNLKKACLYGLVLSLAILLARESGAANGSKGKKTFYRQQVQLSGTPPGVCDFTIEIERVIFQLNSVRNKYKVVRVKILNRSPKPLHLSKNQDKMQISFREREMTAILDLSAHDPGFWDSLSPEIRRALVYPEIVEAGEEENIFVFIPDPELKEMPAVFRYTIETLPVKQVDIPEERLATAF